MHMVSYLKAYQPTAAVAEKNFGTSAVVAAAIVVERQEVIEQVSRTQSSARYVVETLTGFVVDIAESC
jgi:hypothetical protein